MVLKVKRLECLVGDPIDCGCCLYVNECKVPEDERDSGEKDDDFDISRKGVDKILDSGKM